VSATSKYKESMMNLKKKVRLPSHSGFLYGSGTYPGPDPTWSIRIRNTDPNYGFAVLIFLIRCAIHIQIISMLNVITIIRLNDVDWSYNASCF